LPCTWRAGAPSLVPLWHARAHRVPGGGRNWEAVERNENLITTSTVAYHENRCNYIDGTLCAVQFVVAHLAQSIHMDAFEGILHVGPQHRQVSKTVELVLLVEEDGVSSSTAWIHLEAMFH